MNALKSKGKETIVCFSDEKTFVVDPVFNPQNDRWIRITKNEDKDDHGDGSRDLNNSNSSGRFIARSKHPASTMFLGMVASSVV